MKNKSYSEKLKNPKWQKKRLEILNLRGFKCEICGCEEKELQVHHRFYLKGREVWQYDNDVFQVLCCDCHDKEHKKETKKIIPNKYLEIFNYLELIEDVDKFNIDSVEFILHSYLNECKDKDFLRNLSNACNSNSFLNVLIYILSDFSEREKTYVDLSLRIMNLEQHIKKNKDGRLD